MIAITMAVVIAIVTMAMFALADVIGTWRINHLRTCHNHWRRAGSRRRVNDRRRINHGRLRDHHRRTRVTMTIANRNSNRETARFRLPLTQASHKEDQETWNEELFHNLP